MNRNRVKGEFNNQNLFKNFNEFKKRKFYNNLNSDFKFFKKDNDITTHIFNNNIKRNAYTYNDRNNNVCIYYKKKIIKNLIILIVINLRFMSLR